jgi:DNA polymerase III subunit epsilon
MDNSKTMAKRMVVLDTETTGLEPLDGHRIIEIGCVELIDRKLTGNTYHQYINPERLVDEGALEIHGITDEFLSDKPVFSDIYDDFVQFVRGSELVIHNAPFDVGFINHEFLLLQKQLDSTQDKTQQNVAIEKIDDICAILDTLKLARDNRPGQKNNLDALCRHYNIDNSNRQLHGALLDSEILSDVYLAMTGGQTSLILDSIGDGSGPETIQKLASDRAKLKIIQATDKEIENHLNYLKMLEKKSGLDEIRW